MKNEEFTNYNRYVANWFAVTGMISFIYLSFGGMLTLILEVASYLKGWSPQGINYGNLSQAMMAILLPFLISTIYYAIAYFVSFSINFDRTSKFGYILRGYIVTLFSIIIIVFLLNYHPRINEDHPSLSEAMIILYSLACIIFCPFLGAFSGYLLWKKIKK